MLILEKQANIIFQGIVKEKLKEHEFEYESFEDNQFGPPFVFRRQGDKTERIGSFHLEFFNKKLLGILSFSKRFNSIEDIWGKHYHKIYPVGKTFNKQSLSTIATNLKALEYYSYDPNNIGSWYRLKQRFEDDASIDGIDRLASTFIQNIEERILPFFKKYDSLSSLDSVLNHTPESYWECVHIFTAKGLYFKKMIVAKLAKNPNYEQICEFCWLRINEAIASNKESQLNVYSDLRRELDSEKEILS